MITACASEGSSTLTTWKRRFRAASSSKYFLYSFHVVAAMVRSSPRARAGLSRLAASPWPACPPAPILDLALDAGAGLQQRQVEHAQRHALQRVGHVARGDPQGEPLDHRRLADA